MTWMNPWRKLRCPYCFREVALGDCDIVSGQADRVVVRPRPTGLGRLLARLWVQSISGERAVQELASWQCSQCQELLPPNSDRARMAVIGLIGGGAAGKTHYLAALVQRLEHGSDLRGVGCVRFAPLNQDVVDRYQRDYYATLFEYRRRIPLTPPLVSGQTNRPLIFTLLFERTRGLRRYQEINLVLYDGSGEQMVIQPDLVTFHPYILHASGLILMVDPLSMPGVGPNLPRYLRDVPSDAYAPPHLLQTVLTFYQQQFGLSVGKLLDIPLAVTLAKADVLRYIPHAFQVPQGLRTDSSYVAGFRPSDALATSQEVEEVFRRLGEPGFLALTKRFRNVRYFAVSATGGPATADNTFPAITPTRCLDPLFWLLHQLGVIDGRGKD